MRRYTLVHSLWQSFYSRDFYQDVGQNWPGVGFLYLLLLLALVWIPSMVKLHQAFGSFAAKEGQAMIQQFPRILIKRGEVSVDPPGPHYIRDAETGRPFVVIDTSAEAGAIDQFPDGVVLLTKTKLIVRKAAGNETRAYDLSHVDNFSLDRSDLERWLKMARSGLALLVYPFALLFSFIYRIVQALLYGVFGLMFAAILKIRLGYQALVRLSAVAVTPAIILDTVRDLASKQIPMWWLFCFLLAMGYLFFAVKSNVDIPRAGLGAPGPLMPA